MPPPAPRLSVCIIARDAEATLGDTLASVRGVADEVLVTDTGSRDDTATLARDGGADVDHFTWVDDFSAAVNHAVARATGDWVLNLDSDETLRPESVDELTQLLRRSDLLAATVLRRDLVDLKDRSRYTHMRQLRLFRPRPELRYRGRLHRQFHPPARETAERLGMALHDSTVELDHVGYVGDLPQQKLVRSARLMELELQDRPDQFYYHVELGRTCVQMDDPRGGPLLRRAAEQAATADARRRLPRPMLAQLIEHQIVSAGLPPDHPFAPGPALPPVEALRIAADDFPDNAPLVHHRAAAAFRANDFTTAAALLEHLLHLGRDHTYDADASFNPDILGPGTRLNLGAACVRLGRLDEARAHFATLHDDPTHGPAARANLAQLDALRG